MYASDTLDDNMLGGQEYTPRFANFGPRLGAWFLDVLFTLPIVGAGVYFTMISPNWNGVLAVSILSLLYKPVMEKVFSATLGKMVLKLKVVAKEGLPISWGQALMRYIPWVIVFAFNMYFSYQFFQAPGFEDVSGFTEYMQFGQEYQLENGVSPVIQILQSVIGLLPLISALIMLGNARRQSGHDIVAETYVIHTKPKVAAL
jgi:uncharacterized RDD family membrane protein YckC